MPHHVILISHVGYVSGIWSACLIEHVAQDTETRLRRRSGARCSPLTPCGQLAAFAAHLYTNTILISVHVCVSTSISSASVSPRANSGPPDQSLHVLASLLRLLGHAENGMSGSSFCRLNHDLLCVHARSGHIPLHASERPGERRFRTARPRSISTTC